MEAYKLAFAKKGTGTQNVYNQVRDHHKLSDCFPNDIAPLLFPKPFT